VKELLNDPVRRAMMADHCRRIVLAEYSLDVQARAYLSLYESLLERSKRAARPADNKV
jgi:glycosyltransferase involved in cell wall biosynthesis